MRDDYSSAVLTADELDAGFGLFSERLHFILSGTPERAARACEQSELLPRPYDPGVVEDRIRRLLASTPRASLITGAVRSGTEAHQV